MLLLSATIYWNGHIRFRESPNYAFEDCRRSCRPISYWERTGHAYQRVPNGYQPIGNHGCLENGMDDSEQCVPLDPEPFRFGHLPRQLRIRLRRCFRTMEASTRTLLVVDTWSDTPYHNVIEQMFPIFQTVLKLARLLERDPMHFEIAYGGADDRLIPQMEQLWKLLFGHEPMALRTVSGCYRNVAYGQLQEQTPLHNNGPQPYEIMRMQVDPSLTAFLIAFSRTLRRFAGTSATKPTPEQKIRFLLLEHYRSPDWLYDANWGERVSVETLDLNIMPLQVQMQRFTHASGIISVEGSAFVNQLFLPLQSALLIIQARGCTVFQWHSSVAQYLGHAVVEWVGAV